MTRMRWDRYFMNIAEDIGKRSTCVRKDRKVGAVIVNEVYEIIGTGYNGNPRKMRHCSEIGCIREKQRLRPGEHMEVCTGVHAEMNALIQAGKNSKGGTLYTRFCPCTKCAALIVNAGIKRVVYAEDYPNMDGEGLLELCDVTVEKIEKAEA